jgi:hypothetical protein
MKFITFKKYKENDMEEQQKVNEMRMNPQIGTILANDREFKRIIKDLRNWYKGKISYIEVARREYFTNLVVEEIKKLFEE